MTLKKRSDTGIEKGTNDLPKENAQANRDEQLWLSQIPSVKSHLKAKSLASVLDKLILLKGYAAEQSVVELQEQWRIAVGEKLASQSKVGKVQRGTLNIYAANSMVMSELDLSRMAALRHLKRTLPDSKIKSIKIRLLG